MKTSTKNVAGMVNYRPERTDRHRLATKIKIIFLLALIQATLLAMFAGEVSATPITALYYESAPESWVGGGETILVKPSDHFDFIPSNNAYYPAASFTINNFSQNPDFWSTRWWNLDFAAPFGRLLRVGHYSNATRYPFQNYGDPGLSFAGNGRGDNQLTGFFDVLEVSYGQNGLVSSFAADFVQYDENIEAWWNRGSIRFNSTIPLPLRSVPEPQSLALLAIGYVALIATRRRKYALTAAPE